MFPETGMLRTTCRLSAAWQGQSRYPCNHKARLMSAKRGPYASAYLASMSHHKPPNISTWGTYFRRLI